MPNEIPPPWAHWLQHRSLVGGVVELLRAHIQASEWREWLPSERELAVQLQVSRGTLRVALKKLKQAGVIRSQSNRGNRIVPGPVLAVRRRGPKSFGVLLPEPIHRLPHNTVLRIDALRDRLLKQGFQLALHEGRQYYRRNGGPALDKLAAINKHDCWLMCFSSPSMQAWFQRRKLPCVVVGSCYDGIDLPTIGMDHHSVGRHVAGTLISHGHRRMAFVHRRDGTAANLLIRDGLVAGCAASTEANVVKPAVVEFDGDVDDFSRALLRVLRAPEGPTAIVLSNALFSVTALTFLLLSGRRVPEEVSILCTSEALFLKFTVPPIGHYSLPGHVFISKLMRLIHQLCDEGCVRKQHTLIFPGFDPGRSLRKRT